MSAAQLPDCRFEVVAVDRFMVRLFDRIDEANMPWMLAASLRLREGFAGFWSIWCRRTRR